MPVLIPLMVGAVGMMVGKKLGPKPTGATATPESAVTPPVTPTPPTTAATGSADVKTAGQAAARTRRKALSRGNSPWTLGTGGTGGAAPSAPKTLLGY